MGSDARGGINFTPGNASGSKYAVKPNMGDKPVNFVDWFAAARVSNWLMNGATGTSSTETGAYTLVGGTSGTAPAVNNGATFYIPTAVTADGTGIGSAGSTGNFANYDFVADWGGQDGNVTTVGTNSGASAYGAFDMGGNVLEWNDLNGAAGSSRELRGGGWNSLAAYLSSSIRFPSSPSYEQSDGGFRLASPVAVPEASTYAMALAGLACGGYTMFRRRRAR